VRYRGLCSGDKRAMTSTTSTSTASSSSLSYHPVAMTVNGVTMSVLVPLPKSNSHGRPITAKLPDGSSVLVMPKSDKRVATVTCKNNVVLATAASSSTAAPDLPRQQPATVLASSTTGSNKRMIVTVKPIVRHSYQLFGGRGTVVPVVQPRLITPTAVAVDTPSGQRRIVHVVPPPATVSSGKSTVNLSVVRPMRSSTAAHRGVARPIILRKHATVKPIVVQPIVTSHESSLTACTAVGSPSTLTVVSSPRTLSWGEAVAAGWYDDRADIGQTTSDVDPPYAVRHIVPMETDCDELKPCHRDSPSVDKLCGDTTEQQSPRDDRIVVVDNETQMKVIEIFPDDADIEDDVKQLGTVHIKDEFAPTASSDADCGRQCSSVSTETAVSDAEPPPTSNREDFVVLAEWSQDDVPTDTWTTPKDNTPVGDSVRRIKRRKRKSYKWFKRHKSLKRQSSSLLSETIYRARRTGGRPKTAAERYGIIDCFVSLPVLRLPKPSVDVRNWWRHICCRKSQIQRCRCASTSTTDPDSRSSTSRELVDTSELIQPSMVASRSDVTLPCQLSGPTVDGVTPLLVRQPDGRLASVVAKRTTPGGTSSDANKKKYLLIKAKSASFLVPVNNLAEGDADAATVPTPSGQEESPTPTVPSLGTSSVTTKSETVSDSSGHRERIQQLKERLRQQEEDLKSIRSQLSCSAVQKFDLDSIRY